MYKVIGYYNNRIHQLNTIDETIEYFANTHIDIIKAVSFASGFTVRCDYENILEVTWTFEEALEIANSIIKKWNSEAGREAI